ncbi:endothelin-converting enzyme 1-like [Centruroides sculpturatus]|uniref:endothelin-converting enzyme 1-like n=1 Tax=Centruroides sculpturatus TaxID=218467 RepID=UPI000C6D6EA7|nr:endothelin-converting enzyme 1-like [Centruroides sculpturatus]
MFLNYGGAMFLNELLTFHFVSQNGINIKLKQKTTASSSEMKWSQCKTYITRTASPVLDYLYGNYRKEKTIDKELINYMVKAMEEMVAQSTWLDEPTKNAVQDKLNHMIAFVSLPEWTQDVRELEKYFEGLPKMTSNAFENAFNLKQFDTKKLVGLRGKKNDRSKWPRYSQMGGSQVNAFYVPDFNIVVIPAGIQQLPYYHADRPNYMNFGGMGLIYGHEMTHGLDESGSLRDKYGNLKNWWTDKSKTEFKKRSKCFVDQYSSYHYDGLDITVDGKQTLSENIADNGGIRQAYLGYQKWVKDHGKEKRLPGLEKYSPEQLFFVAFAESWCSSIHPPSLLASSHADDSHSADQFRVIGSLVNMKEFSEVFKCKSGSKMNPKNKCIIW